MKLPTFNLIVTYLKGIKEVGDSNKIILQTIERVQDKDREDIRDLERRLGHVEVELKSMSELISKIPNQARDKMAEASAPILESASNLTDAINAAEVVPVDKKTIEDQKKPWYKFW